MTEDDDRSAHRQGDRGGGAHDTDRLIDEVLARGDVAADADADPGDHEFAAAIQRVRALASDPVPAESRSRHLARIRTEEPAAAPTREPRRTAGWMAGLQRRLAPIAAAATALVLFAGGGTVALAQNADPDDGLYPVKLTSEHVWAALPRGSERAAEVQLTLAERRIGEAQRAPHRADELVAAGVSNIEAAAEEKPEEAIATFVRLLGGGDDALPENASPRARWALARNCHRIAAKHGLEDLAAGCPHPDDIDMSEHPGRGMGPGDGPRGWGPEGRPEGHVGPPPGVPAHERTTPGEDADD